MASRAAVSAQKKREENICPICGINPLRVDPRYERDLEIKLALTMGQKPSAIAKRFGVTRQTVANVSKKTLGKPKRLTRCDKCMRADLDRKKDRYRNRANPPAQFEIPA